MYILYISVGKILHRFANVTGSAILLYPLSDYLPFSQDSSVSLWCIAVKVESFIQDSCCTKCFLLYWHFVLRFCSTSATLD